MLGITTIVLTWALSRILDWGVQDKDARDIGLIAICIIGLVGFFFALVFSPWLRQSGGSSNDTATAVGERAAQLSSARPTGETTVGSVASRIGQFSDGETIDYYAPAYTTARGDFRYGYSELKLLSGLRLGEMALIRRLAVAPDQQEAPQRSRAVLQASGITHPESSIAKLEDLELIEADNDAIRLMEGGRRLVYLSNQALTHDPGLVSAYRQITPNINRSIRFDRRPLRD